MTDRIKSASLLRARHKLNLTQQQVADRAGITLRMYQRFESGERELRHASVVTALAIAAALHVDLQDII